MKNITVSVDDEVYRRARIKAAARDTSVSALVRQFLADLADDGGEFERLKRLEQNLREQITEFQAASRLTRDELYSKRR